MDKEMQNRILDRGVAYALAMLRGEPIGRRYSCAPDGSYDLICVSVERGGWKIDRIRYPLAYPREFICSLTAAKMSADWKRTSKFILVRYLRSPEQRAAWKIIGVFRFTDKAIATSWPAWK